MPNTPAPPRPELLALLETVKDQPDDDTPRLVLADWLDEQGNKLDTARAAFIRKDIAIAREGRAPLPAELEETKTVRADWLESLKEFVAGVRFHRGLPVVTVPGLRFGWFGAPGWLASEDFAFVQLVHLDEAGGPRTKAAVTLPEFRHVPGFNVNPFLPFGTASAARVFSSPNLTGLRHIGLRSVQPGVAGLEALAANPALARLRTLLLAHNKLVDKGVAALAKAEHLTNLEVLNLSDNNIGDKGAEALAASKAFPSLRELNLRENVRLTDHGKRALRDAYGDRVKLD